MDFRTKNNQIILNSKHTFQENDTNWYLILLLGEFDW